MRREARKRNKIIIGLIVIVVLMSVGYAAFQTNLNIKGTSKISSNWDIRITNVKEGEKTGSAESAKEPSWTELTASMEANLYEKGDAMEYEVTVENKGSLDAKLEDIITKEGTNNEAVLITFSGYTKGEKLYKGESKQINVKIAYNPEYSGGEASSEVTVEFNYGQAEGGTIPDTNDYLLTYDYKTNGGITSDVDEASLPEGTDVDLNSKAYKEGYTFVGWNTDKDAIEGLTSFKMPSSNTTLYAIYKKEIEITYIKGENVASIGKDKDTCTIYNLETSCEITLPSITPREGYTSVGWSETQDASSGINAGTKVIINSRKTYYTSAKDITPPTTPTITNSANGAWATSVTITLKSTDTGSGIDHYEWYENGAWTTRALTTTNGVGTITYTADRNLSIQFRAIDKAGNASAVATTPVKIDTVAPTLTISNSSATNSITISANASAASGISKYEYSIDGGSTWKESTTNTYTFTGLKPNTSYNVQVRVTSGSGKQTTKTVTATTKSITLPTFSESETESGKDVTIIYPSGCGSTYTCTYIKDGSSPVTVTSTTTTASFTSSGTLIATVSDGTNEVSATHNIEILATLMSWASNSKTDFHSSTYKSKITSAEVVDYKEVPSNAVESWDVSNNSSGDIMAWVIDDPEAAGYYKLYIGGDGGVRANTNSSYIFIGFTNLKTVDLTKLDTSKVTNMSYMFSGCSSLTSLDVSNFDTSNVTTMSYMFYNCSSLTSLDLSNFNTSNVIYMDYMFSSCRSLTSLDLSGFDTSKVTTMYYMFRECRSLTSLDVSNFNTSNVTNMTYMFYNCSSLTSLDLSNFNTSNVTDMSHMFDYCRSLTSLDVSNFDTSNVTTMNGMFSGCSSLTSLDVSNFDTSKVTNMRSMFSGCSKLTSLDVSNFDTSNVTDMAWMFYNCSGLTSLDVSNFDTSKVTNMSYMFYLCGSLTSLDLSNFDTSKVTNMSYMFRQCSSLTSLDLSGFDTSNVTNMSNMFDQCSSLTSLDVSNFDTSNVTDMAWMFSNCISLTSLDVSNFDTSKVTNMSYMFRYATKLTVIYVGPNWTMDNVTSSTSMFTGCGVSEVTLKS